MTGQSMNGDDTVGIKRVKSRDEKTHLVPVVVVGLAVGLRVCHRGNGSCRAVIHALSFSVGFLRAV